MLKNMSIRSADNRNYYLQMINPKIYPILSQIKTYLTSLYQERLADLLLYGSQARGDAKPESDIDILVILKEDKIDAWQEIDITSEFIANLCLHHSIVISRSFVNRQRFQTENSPFFINVRREGISL